MPTAPSEPPPPSLLTQFTDLPTEDGDFLRSNFLLEDSENDPQPPPPRPTAAARRRRPVCERCLRPRNVCICCALPAERIQLKSCHCVVLQHPRELERKNRSLPFLQLSLDASSLTTIVSRRLNAQSCPPRLDYLLLKNDSLPAAQPKNTSNGKRRRHCWLIFPSSEAVSLSQALQELDDELEADRDVRRTAATLEGPAPSQDDDEKNDGGGALSASEPSSLTVLFLDGTWQLAGEMFRWQEWDRFRLVQLDADEFAEILERPCRYPMRTPPSPRHLSTHECISYVLSRIEHHRGTNRHPDLYRSLLQPLDLAVRQYQTFLMKNNG